MYSNFVYFYREKIYEKWYFNTIDNDAKRWLNYELPTISLHENIFWGLALVSC